MIAITKNDEDFFKFEIIGVTSDSWLASVGGKLPEDIVAVVDENDEMFETVREAARFKPVFKNNKLVGIEELPPLQQEATPEQIVEANLKNLDLTDYKAIKNAEVVAIFVSEQFGLDLPYNPIEVKEERDILRADINTQEEKIEESTDNLSSTNL